MSRINFLLFLPKMFKIIERVNWIVKEYLETVHFRIVSNFAFRLLKRPLNAINNFEIPLNINIVKCWKLFSEIRRISSINQISVRLHQTVLISS